MASAKNKVIAGYLQGKYVTTFFNSVSVGDKYINKDEVEICELVTADKVKSGTSAVLRGAAGAALLGPVGLLAGLSAKSKGINTVAILWKTGEQSLIEVDDKIYKKILISTF